MVEALGGARDRHDRHDDEHREGGEQEEEDLEGHKDATINDADGWGIKSRFALVGKPAVAAGANVGRTRRVYTNSIIKKVPQAALSSGRYPAVGQYVIEHQDITIVNVGYRSTNFWVVSSGRSRLLVDLGWPGMMRALLANLKRKGVPIEEIRYGLATHYHIDHAGCAQELKRRGMRLIVAPEQVEAIPAMTRWIKPTDIHVDITGDDNLVLPVNQSRTFLAGLGISGEIIHTPGHSDDSVSLVLDNGAAFTGDLTVESMIATEDADVVSASWQRLRERGVTTIYGGHGPVRTLAAWSV